MLLSTFLVFVLKLLVTHYPIPNYRESAVTTVINSKGRNTKHWYTLSSTRKSSLKEPFSQIWLQAFLYIDYANLGNHFSTPSFFKTRQTTLLGTRSKAFSETRNSQYKPFFLAAFLFSKCLKMKLTFVVCWLHVIYIGLLPHQRSWSISFKVSLLTLKHLLFHYKIWRQY